VLNRANARLTIFENEPDHAAFEQVFEQAVDRTQARRLAYCLLPQWTASLLLGVQARVASECVLYPRTHLLALRACVFRRGVDFGDRLCATGSASVFVCSCATGSASVHVSVCHWLCQCVFVPLAVPVPKLPTESELCGTDVSHWLGWVSPCSTGSASVFVCHWLCQC
jgi:hypothetical protein